MMYQDTLVDGWDYSMYKILQACCSRVLDLEHQPNSPGSKFQSSLDRFSSLGLYPALCISINIRTPVTKLQLDGVKKSHY